MSAGTDLLKQVWRDYVTDGVPSSGENEPVKSQIRQALDRLAIDLAGASTGDPAAVITALQNAYDRLDEIDLSGIVGAGPISRREAWTYRNGGTPAVERYSVWLRYDAATGQIRPDIWLEPSDLGPDDEAVTVAGWYGYFTQEETLRRANHTGTQSIATVAGLQAALDALGPGATPAGGLIANRPFPGPYDGFKYVAVDLNREFQWVAAGSPNPMPPYTNMVTSAYVGLYTLAELNNLAIGKTNFLPQGNVKGFGEYDTLVDDLAKLDAGAFAARISDFRARVLTSTSPLAVALDWDADGALTGFVLSWGVGYSVALGGGVRSFRPPLWSEQTKLTSIGDSMMEGKWVEGAAAALGLTLNNVAKYSSGAYQAYRLGTRPLYFTVTGNSIPASGASVLVTAINGGAPTFDNIDDAFSGRHFLNTYPGDTIATNCSVSGWYGGRHGVVSVPNGGTTTYTFTPDDGVTAASPVTAQAIFVPDNLAHLATDELWIRMSQNYFYASYTPTFPNNINPRVLDDIQAIVDRARGQRIIILALTPGNDFGPATSNIGVALRYFNNQLRVRWPQYAAWLDNVTYGGVSFTGNNMDFIRAYGSDGSANDIADIANGILPRSCVEPGASELHLNAKGQGLERTFLQLFRAAQKVPPAITANTLFALTAAGINPRTGAATAAGPVSTSVSTGPEAIASSEAREAVTATRNLSLVALDPLSGYVFAIQDKATNRTALRITTTGTVEIDDLSLLAGSVPYASLSVDTQALMFTALDPASGYVFAIQDPVTKRSALRVKTNGDVEIDSLIAGEGSVGIAAFAADAQRVAVPQTTDVVPVLPDVWRGNTAGIPVRTAAEGTAWVTLPAVLTQSVRGINGSGTALQFRKSPRLPVKGRRYAGVFDASIASPAGNYRGTFTTALPSTAGAAAGDYWIFINQSPVTLGTTYNIGDLAVFDGSALSRQPGPTPIGGAAYTNRVPGDWWIISVAGTFDGVSYAIGDRVVYLGFQSASGFGYARWVKGDYAKKGELFYRGEFDASGGAMPSAPADGELYQVSVAGVAAGITWAVGDYAIREAGVWGQVATETIRTVAASTFVNLPCAFDASEWEVRRVDKSNTRATTQLSVRRQTAPRRNQDTIALYSDSMFGVSSVGSNILISAGRTGTVFSFGGGTSEQVLNMLEYEISRLTDRYRSWVHGFWHGQNNQPAVVGDTNWAQITQSALRMRELVGARDSRLFFMSILGMHTMSWNGTRLVNSQLEDPFASTGPLWALEQWYEAMFPGQWVSPRQTLLTAAAASASPELLFPGMTEAQVAATYGIVPTRYYAGWAALPASVQTNPASAAFTGYHSTAGLPTGGAAGDYKIRTGGGTVGNMIFNVAGTWVEPSFDSVHTSPIGSAALGLGVGTFIINRKF